LSKVSMECGRSRETAKRSDLAGFPDTAYSPHVLLDDSREKSSWVEAAADQETRTEPTNRVVAVLTFQLLLQPC